MSKQCKTCGTSIGDAYDLCSQCLYKQKQAQPIQGNELKEIAEHLKHLNWNLGKLVSHLIGDKQTLKKIEEAEGDL